MSIASPASATTPTISSASPAAGATNVSTTATISVTFNTAMNSVTTASFFILDPTGYQIATPAPTVAANKYSLKPTVALSPCTTYTVIVTTGVKSNDTNTPLALQYAQSFTTATTTTAPTITGRVPASGATGVIENADITVTFSQQMNTTTIDTTSFGLNNGASGTISYTTSPTNNGTIAKFTPSPNLVADTQYTATVTTSVANRCTIPLAANATNGWNFVVRGTAAPYVADSAPANGAENIPITSPITINFSSRVHTLGSANISVTLGGIAVPGTITNDSGSGMTATFTPSTPFLYSSVYQFTLSNVTDLNNVALSGTTSFSFTTVAQQIMQYCSVPPFVANSSNVVQPNVLVLIGNSNSMDEDFMGNAVGSYAPTSKSVIGKLALKNIIQTYANIMRIGIMTYNLPSVSKQYISNSPYFASYDPRSYCPNPPSDGATDFCSDYCTTGNTASKTACHNGCTAQNPLFDETYMDSAITAQTFGARRTKYCGLVYPKTNVLQNPSAPTYPVYFKQALPLYTPSAPTYNGGFCYAQNYHPLQEITNTSTYTDSYNCWSAKSGTSDGYTTGATGYSGSNYYNNVFVLTDSDLGNGYGNVGQRNASAYVGPTWFANSSPGTGYLKVPIATNNSVNAQLQLLNSKLAAYSGDSTGYMACSTGNTCNYIVNAGLSPTAGALKTASNYFTGTLSGTTSPITQPCQKNFIIYLTDGLPSVDINGTPGQGPTLIGSDVNPAANTVLSVVNSLRSVTASVNGTAYPFDVKTFVLGYGLTGSNASNVDLIAKHGGTGGAYNASNTSQVTDALQSIFNAISEQISSGTAASILSNSQGSGANILQAVFYPLKYFENSQATWIGEMQNLWYYVDPFLLNSSIREDTDFSSTSPNHVLDLRADNVVTYSFDTATGQTKVDLTSDPNGNQTGQTIVAQGISPDDVNSLWRAGQLLWAQNPDTRTIHTSINGYSLLSPAAESPSKGGFYASSATDSRIVALRPYLQASASDNNVQALSLLNYVRGSDGTGSYRPRRVSITLNGTQTTNEWKLGDIVNSTPKVQSSNQLNFFDQGTPVGYSDKSYTPFVTSASYLNRGMVYVGANDGMLHAFKLGKLTVAKGADTGVSSGGSSLLIDGFIKATLTGTNLGQEQWAYVPRSTLPYLQYLADPVNYKHIYYVDGPTSISDVSIGYTATCTADDYSKCPRDTVAGTNWRTILLGSMGLGGGTRAPNSSCLTSAAAGTCVRTPIFDPADTATPQTKGVGYSSYFALDITNQYFNQDGSLAGQPALKWEFPPAGSADTFGMGYATSGMALIRIAAKRPPVNGVSHPDTKANGKWFGVIASGPTGPIDAIGHRFIGRSDQNLKLFIIDLGATITASAPFTLNQNYWVIDTQITNAFGGSIAGNVIDTDKWNATAEGNYQDDALYIGFTKKRIDATTGETSWTDGGVGRLLTRESTDPSTWTFSRVIDSIGPVTTGISKLQDRQNGKLWLYFGTGRFYFNGDDAAASLSNQRYTFGVRENCYTATNTIDPACSTPVLGFGSLTNQTSSPVATLPSGSSGWYVALDPADSTNLLGAERSVTDPIALTNGTVFFTSFKPTTDPCKYGGNSYVWGFNYSSGAAPSANALAGKMLVQESTGAFQEIILGSALTANNGRKSLTPMIGKPPADAPPGITNANNKPSKKIIHIQER